MSEAKSNAPKRYQVGLAHKVAEGAKGPHHVTFRLQPACHCKVLELELEPGVELEETRVDHAVLLFDRVKELVLCPPPQRPGRLLELLVKGEPTGKNPALWGSLFVLSGLGPPYPGATLVDEPAPVAAAAPAAPVPAAPAALPARTVVEVGRPPPLTAEQIAAARAAAEKARADAKAAKAAAPAAPTTTATPATPAPSSAPLQPEQQQLQPEPADPFGVPDWLAQEMAAERGGGL